MKLLNSALASTSGSASTTWTYVGNEAPDEISFANDSGGDAILVIGDHTIKVKAGESFDATFPVTISTIDITINGDYRLVVGV